MPYSSFKDLLRDLGQAINLPSLAPDDDNYCCLGFDDKIITHFQYTPDTDNLLVFCQIGHINENQLHIAYPQICKANLFWQGTHNGVLGIDDSSHELVYAYQISLSSLDFDKFQKDLEHFVSIAESWIDKLTLINQGEPTSPTPPPSPSDPSFPPDGLKI